MKKERVRLRAKDVEIDRKRGVKAAVIERGAILAGIKTRGGMRLQNFALHRWLRRNRKRRSDEV